jgi:hypothetical protein
MNSSCLDLIFNKARDESDAFVALMLTETGEFLPLFLGMCGLSERHVCVMDLLGRSWLEVDSTLLNFGAKLSGPVEFCGKVEDLHGCCSYIKNPCSSDVARLETQNSRRGDTTASWSI